MCQQHTVITGQADSDASVYVENSKVQKIARFQSSLGSQSVTDENTFLFDRVLLIVEGGQRASKIDAFHSSARN